MAFYQTGYMMVLWLSCFEYCLSINEELTNQGGIVETVTINQKRYRKPWKYILVSDITVQHYKSFHAKQSVTSRSAGS